MNILADFNITVPLPNSHELFIALGVLILLLITVAFLIGKKLK